MMKYITNALILLFVAYSPFSFSHCQIPCGIYDDNARVKALLEDAMTIRKSMAMLTTLAGKTDVQSINQKVRWVMNKEKHAQNVISTISDYFLTQRLNAKQKDYVDRLKKHHAVIVSAMKVKQNTQIEFAHKLEAHIRLLLAFYPEKKSDHTHY